MLEIEYADVDVVVFGHGKTIPVWGKIFGNWSGEQTIDVY